MVDTYNIYDTSGNINDIELAYRRGCHQAIAYVKKMLRDPRVKQLNVSPVEIIEFCDKWTSESRYEPESKPWYLDILMRDVIDELSENVR